MTTRQGPSTERADLVVEPGHVPSAVVTTGYRSVDRLLSGGLRPAALHVVAACPSMGKTAFAVCLAASVATAGLPVLFVSLQTTGRELVARLLAVEARVDSGRLRDQFLIANDVAKLDRARAWLAAAPLFIHDTTPVTAADIATAAGRLLARTGRLGCVIVDHVELVAGPDTTGRADIVDDCARCLQGIARELSVPVVATSQLAPMVASRRNKRPTLSDLGAAGGLARHADVVMFLYRDSLYHPDRAEHFEADVIVARNRDGLTGTVPLVFLARYGRFDSYAYGM